MTFFKPFDSHQAQIQKILTGSGQKKKMVTLFNIRFLNFEYKFIFLVIYAQAPINPFPLEFAPDSHVLPYDRTKLRYYNFVCKSIRKGLFVFKKQFLRL